MRRHIAYLKYVLRHKWFVFRAGLQLRVPLWMLILHDWDKFLPDEWFGYARAFYKPDGTKQYDEQHLVLPWNAHQKRNKHHWQYWMITWDRGVTENLPMPEVYRREMIADWMGAGRAIVEGWTPREPLKWYEKNKDNIKLHPDTRTWVEQELKRISDDYERDIRIRTALGI